jgi:acetyltransferase-like isoleucine patch superfamily enzyme
MILINVFNKLSNLFRELKNNIFYYYYRLVFGSFGRKSFFKGEVWLTNPKYIFIGKSCQIGPYCRLETFTNYGLVKTSPVLIIGDNTSIQHAVHIYCANSVILEKGCLIASGCMITDNNHGTNPIGEHYVKQPLKSRPTILREDVWLGENVCVLAGSEIGKRSIIRSNSVVVGKIPEYSIASGNPAKVIKKFNFNTNIWERV